MNEKMYYQTKINLANADKSVTNKWSCVGLVLGIAIGCISEIKSLKDIIVTTYFKDNYFIISFECTKHGYEVFGDILKHIFDEYGTDIVTLHYFDKNKPVN